MLIPARPNILSNVPIPRPIMALLALFPVYGKRLLVWVSGCLGVSGVKGTSGVLGVSGV